MIRVALPTHLRTLARTDREVQLDVEGQVTQSSVLDALEARYPMLRGTMRDHVTKKRRAFVRFFACAQDLSHDPTDAPLPDAIASGRLVEDRAGASRNRLQTSVLLEAIAAHGFDAVFGGGRRDEEKARAKERVFSHRDEFGQWDPKNQRPELWNLYNGRHRAGEHLRVFPLSNWTELDVWQYIATDGIELPSIYYAHRREVFRRDGMIMAVGPYLPTQDGEEPFEALVRFRTVGDMSCTAAVESSAATADEIVVEIAASRITERGATRADDRFSEAAMEDRKREGYF